MKLTIAKKESIQKISLHVIPAMWTMNLRQGYFPVPLQINGLG